MPKSSFPIDIHVLIQPKCKFLYSLTSPEQLVPFLCLWSFGLLTTHGFLFEVAGAELRAKGMVCLSQA